MRRAVDMLYAHDAMLFKVKASEWAIAHRLAVYLESGIPGWNVQVSVQVCRCQSSLCAGAGVQVCRCQSSLFKLTADVTALESEKVCRCLCRCLQVSVLTI